MSIDLSTKDPDRDELVRLNLASLLLETIITADEGEKVELRVHLPLTWTVVCVFVCVLTVGSQDPFLASHTCVDL